MHTYSPTTCRFKPHFKQLSKLSKVDTSILLLASTTTDRLIKANHPHHTTSTAFSASINPTAQLPSITQHYHTTSPHGDRIQTTYCCVATYNFGVGIGGTVCMCSCQSSIGAQTSTFTTSSFSHSYRQQKESRVQFLDCNRTE